MRNKSKFFYLFLLFLGLQGCVSVQETYHPGYYQQAYHMPERYQRAFYDYYGNFHSAHWDGNYQVPGRWHKAYLTNELVQRQALVNRHPLKYGEVPAEMLGQMGVDRFDPTLD